MATDDDDDDGRHDMMVIAQGSARGKPAADLTLGGDDDHPFVQRAASQQQT